MKTIIDLPKPVTALSGQILGRHIPETKVIKHGNQPYSTLLVLFIQFFIPLFP
jgi:hypothetical protein